jgi:uncharacterized membrane protein
MIVLCADGSSFIGTKRITRKVCERHREDQMLLLLCAFLVGIVSGLRSMMGPAVVSWSARLGLLEVGGTSVAFMGYRYTPIIFAVLAVGELIADKLPFTPSRKMAPGFTARIFSGALVGATIGASGNMMLAGLVIGAIGAVAGTLGGAAARGKLAAAFHRDLPAALLEDAFGLALAILAVVRIR